MSASSVLIIIGAAFFLIGLVKLGRGQSGGFNLKNFMINFGGTSTQTNTMGNVTPDGVKGNKPDWVGIVIAGLGFLTALIGWLKG
jgi:hypothetical protein